MVELVVTAEQAKFLAEARDSAEIMDNRGNRLGFFARRFTDQDIAVAALRAASQLPGKSTAAVLGQLKSLRPQ
jgi:hypothetical protein